MKLVLVMTALQEELEALLRLMPNGRSDWRKRQSDQGYFYFEHEAIDYAGESFLIRVSTQAQQGPIYATAHTMLMLPLNPDLILMAGICAGNADKGLRLGDVVLSDMAFHYEAGKQTEGGFRPEIECSNVDPVHVQWIKEYCASKGDQLECEGPRRIIVGPFATGSSVVSKAAVFEDLQMRERGVLALDMEAYSVLKAVEISNRKIPAFVIKSVCDFADQNKDDSAHALAAKASAACAFEVAQFVLPMLTAPVAKTTSVNYSIALPRPALTYRDRLRWKALLEWSDDDYWRFARDFDTGEINYSANSGLEFYSLGNDRWLLQVTLDFGAYQGTYSFYYLDETREPKRWKIVKFRTLYWLEDGRITEALDAELFGIAFYEPETETIRTFVKGRGIGDIGSLITYKFRDGETELIEYRQNLEEQDFEEPEDFIPPEEWPLIDIGKTYEAYVPETE